MQTISRRNFVRGGAVATILATTGAIGLSACSKANESNGGQPASDPSSFNVVDTLDCDIVVVGGGVSGIAAAVQAGENGDSVVVLDWANALGGSGIGVEGVFGWNSPLQKEQGIEFDPSAAIAQECNNANWLVDANAWKRLIDASGDNIQWMLDNGVEFSGVIDTYPIVKGDGSVSESDFKCFHWFGGNAAYEGFDDTMAGGSCYEGYVKKMELKLDEYGVDVRLGMRATDLAFDGDGKITGVYAKNENDEYTQVNAKAVIIATGGILNDSDRMRKRGINPDRLCTQISPGSSGDGAHMAIDQAGAREYFRTAYEGWNGIPGTNTAWTVTAVNLGSGGPVLWVNEFAERFTNEDIAAGNFDMAFVPRQCFQQQYAFMTQKFAYEELLGNDANLIADWEERMDQDGGNNAWVADSVKELAEAAGLDADTLEATVNRYNELCDKGSDDDFGKTADKMVAQKEGPFMLIACSYCIDASFGDVCVDRHFRAVDDHAQPIDGLYVIGVEGCMLYSNVYTIDMPGSGCANSVNSGRTAANHAHDFIA